MQVHWLAIYVYNYLKTQMTHTLEDLTYKMKDHPPKKEAIMF